MCSCFWPPGGVVAGVFAGDEAPDHQSEVDERQLHLSTSLGVLPSEVPDWKEPGVPLSEFSLLSPLPFCTPKKGSLCLERWPHVCV